MLLFLKICINFFSVYLLYQSISGIETKQKQTTLPVITDVPDILHYQKNATWWQVPVILYVAKSQSVIL